MAKRPEDMTLPELKVLAFDTMRQLEQLQSNYTIVLDLIKKREEDLQIKEK